MRIHVSPAGLWLVAVCLCFIGSPRAARAQHGDVWLSTDASNKIALGVVNEAGDMLTPGVRALEVILAPDSLPFSPFDFSADDPGFRAAPSELPASQNVDLTLESLSVWSGSALTPASGMSFAFDLSGGFATEANGGMHEHPLYGLTDLPGGATSIPDGVYVAKFHVSTAGRVASAPYLFVMLRDDVIADGEDAETLGGLLEDYEAGGPAPLFGGKNFTFFENVYGAVAAPEPNSLALLGSAGLGLLAVRRGG